ncbi:MAG TPA: universal stress protein [Solirubrobacterales bacterium]|nr:universal stress protein [Solirubrobacterales bacterium]
MQPRILIGYDGTPEGEDALGLGHSLSEVLDAVPVVATVISHPRDGVEDHEFDDAVSKFCEPLFAKARERLDGLDTHEQPVVNDSPAAGIYEQADWHKPSAIVIGSTRHGRAGRVQVGTVGGSLLSGVHCSVAVAPRGYSGGEARLARIGVAVDGSSESWRALFAAAHLAELAKAPLRVISVMGEPHYVLGGLLSPLGPAEYREFKDNEWGRVYEEAVGRIPDDVATEQVLLNGDPAEALADASTDLDLLLLGSRGYGPVKGTLLGSVSSRVMAAAPCPVIVVPRGAGTSPLEA